MRINPNVPVYIVVSILAPTYNYAAAIENDASGFRNTGMSPVDKNVVNNLEFVAAVNLLLTKLCD